MARFLDPRRREPMLLVAALCGLLVAAPFEARAPLFALPGQSLSTVEAALMILLAAGAIEWMAHRGRHRGPWQTALTRPWLVFVAAMGVAAIAAPAHTTNALHMAARLAIAFGVYLVVVSSVVAASSARNVVAAVAVSAAVAGALAVLEYFGVSSVLRFLTLFRDGVAHVGGQVRAAGPFQYPTIASMFLEIGFAFAVALTLLAVDRGRALHVAAALASTVLIAQAIVFTFSRAGLAAMGATLALVGWSRWRRAGFDRGSRLVALIAAIAVMQVVGSRSLETLRLRLTTETTDAWFRAVIEAPIELSLATGSRMDVPVRLTNTGAAVWDSVAVPRIRLAYHWLLAGEDKVLSWDGLRTDFLSPVPPGSRVSVNAAVVAPPAPGEYRLMWDLEQEHRLWFSTEPGARQYITRARVSGPALRPASEVAPTALPRPVERPGRRVLWRAALAMFAARPVTGVGPDNYRLSYGRYAGLDRVDPRVHSNNMYLEVLTGGGLLATLPFAWLCWAVLGQTTTLVRLPADGSVATLATGVAAATAAIALHGLVDSFISFTATYIAIATTLGLGAALSAMPHTDAHRV